MDRTFCRPPYALHVGLGLGVFQTIGYPPNWLFSRAHDNVASVQTVGENCIVNMAWRLTSISIQLSLFPAHINISYNNNNVYILCRKRGGQKTMLIMLMDARPLTITVVN